MRVLASISLALLAGGCAAQPVRPAAAPPPVEHAVRGVPCGAEVAIPFRAAKAGELDDRANAYDTPETVAAIVKHNAMLKAMCP